MHILTRNFVSDDIKDFSMNKQCFRSVSRWICIIFLSLHTDPYPDSVCGFGSGSSYLNNFCSKMKLSMTSNVLGNPSTCSSKNGLYVPGLVQDLNEKTVPTGLLIT